MTSFIVVSDRKTREAEAARFSPLETIEDRSAAFNTERIGNSWSQKYYNGLFDLPVAMSPDVPSISLVFVQSRDGNTEAGNPEDLGGGAVDKHLIYEGLSRVAADAVLAGAKTAAGDDTFFSVWHPEIVALRTALGLPRHPAQIVVTGTACIGLEGLLFNVPDVPVYVISTPGGCALLEREAQRHPSVELVRMNRNDLRRPLEYLRRERGIRRISAIGGRTTASGLIDAGLAQDLCLTTTALAGGQANTPWYVGKQPPMKRLMVRKRGGDSGYPITFEHFELTRPNP